jgi:hypothetical protein
LKRKLTLEDQAGPAGMMQLLPEREVEPRMNTDEEGFCTEIDLHPQGTLQTVLSVFIRVNPWSTTLSAKRIDDLRGQGCPRSA